MENSILISTKKILGLPEEYTAFDHDIIVHINSVFSTLTQLGVGPVEGFMIEDEVAEWEDYVTAGVVANDLNSVRTYVFLKVKMAFDPPNTSFMIEAMDKQIAELEWRLNVAREYALYPYSSEEE